MKMKRQVSPNGEKLERKKWADGWKGLYSMESASQFRKLRQANYTSAAVHTASERGATWRALAMPGQKNTLSGGKRVPMFRIDGTKPLPILLF
jgi:hypothetical protein